MPALPVPISDAFRGGACRSEVGAGARGDTTGRSRREGGRGPRVRRPIESRRDRPTAGPRAGPRPGRDRRRGGRDQLSRPPGDRRPVPDQAAAAVRARQGGGRLVSAVGAGVHGPCRSATASPCRSSTARIAEQICVARPRNVLPHARRRWASRSARRSASSTRRRISRWSSARRLQPASPCWCSAPRAAHRRRRRCSWPRRSAPGW